MANAHAGRRGPTGRALVPAVVLGLLAAAFLLQLLGVLLAASAPVIAGAALGVLLEALLLRLRGLGRALGRVQLSRPVRQLLRDALLLGGLARTDVLHPAPSGAVLLTALLGCWAVHFLCQGVANEVARTRRLPFVTRNIDVSGLRLSPAPPRLFGRHRSLRLVGVAAATTVGGALTAALGDGRWAAGAALGCVAVLCAGTAHLALRLLPGRRPAGEEESLEWLGGWLAEYRPTVGMYFSGGTASAYQANMWLSTLERLQGRPLIVLRERFMVQRIDETDVPILCLPRVSHLMQLEETTLSVLLHPANSGKTSQVLRIPSIKHAFVNHGESDKLSSCNPYAKAYDEVWVAGPAARERYRQADIGVADEDVVEVGRPQLAPIRPYAGPPDPGGHLTVLYAPTWEGWTDDPGNTSIVLAGEQVVRALLADERVRLLYKPHPMTGSVDPRAREADLRIRRLVAEDNARRAARHGGAEGGGGDAQAAAEPGRLQADLAELTASGERRDADEAERMLVRSAPRDERHAERVRQALAAWEEAYWRAAAPWEHRVVTGQRPGIYACFNEADVLVSDVSSVVADFLSSEKPYAVVNTTDLPEPDFRAAFPTVRAATILTPTAEDVPALLASVRDPDRDPLRAARARLKEHLLGPAEPPSLVRFERALLALRAEAAAHRTRGAAAERSRERTEGAGEPEDPAATRSGKGDQVLAEALDDEAP